MVTFQEHIRGLIPQANDLIREYNKVHDFEIKIIPEKSPKVFCVSKEEYQRLYPGENKRALASTDNKGEIYFIEDNFSENVRNFGEYAMGPGRPLIAPFGKGKKLFSDLFLLQVLLHENTHRSCTHKTYNGNVAKLFYEAAGIIYEGDECGEWIRNAKPPLSILNHGTKIRLLHKKGQLNPINESLDEFVTNWVASEIFAPALVENGNSSNYGCAFAGLLAYHSPELPEEGVHPAILAVKHQNREKFLEDYFSGKLPTVTFNYSQSKEMDMEKLTPTLVGLISNDARFLPDIINTLYCPNDK
jgi:hypothetical protein